MSFPLQVALIGLSVLLPCLGMIVKKLDMKVIIIASLLSCIIALLLEFHQISMFLQPLDASALEDISPIYRIPTMIIAGCLISNALFIIIRMFLNKKHDVVDR